MYRFLTLIALFLVTLPIGLTVTGCSTNVTQYCSNAGFGKKVTDVDSIDLEPKLTGISLTFGQTATIATPVAKNCKGTSVNVATYTYGSDNKAVADLTPSGGVCAGTWNRNSGGGIADFTICTPPAVPGTARITAQGGGATSNPITVFVHPLPTSATLAIGSGCFSQNARSQLDATVFTGGSTTAPFCAPYGTTADGFNGCTNNPANGVPDCICNLGHLVYNPQNADVVGIDETGVATAVRPGTTLITAQIASVSLNTDYYSTCPPAKITLSVPPSDVSSTGVIPISGTASVPISATAVDTNGNPLTGLALTYTSTNPQQIAVSATAGAVSTIFPGVAQVSAACEPPSCNNAPINKIGQFSGTGLPVTSSNTLTFQSPGNSSTLLWVGSPQSPYFNHFDLSTSTLSSPVKMPYTPNSMVLDASGTSLYFGSYRELMVYGASASNLTKEDITVPGVVLAVSPAGSTVVICDQLRQLIYLYSPQSGIISTIGGVGTRAAYSADGTTLYITGPNALYVHNDATGWSTYAASSAQLTPNACPLDNTGSEPFCSPDVAVPNPSVGAFLSGSPTTAHSYCYDSAVSPPFFPQTADRNLPATDHLTATADGKHTIGASASPAATLTDILTALPTGACPPAGGGTLQFSSGSVQVPLPIAPAAIDQVVIASDSSLAFVTYSGTTTAGAVLPAYTPAASTSAPGTLTAVTLSGGATAPLAGVFSPDTTQFFVGTAGDDLIHIIDVKSLTDKSTINPSLPDANGKPVPAQFLAVKPRKIA